MVLHLTPEESATLTDALWQAYLRYDGRRQTAKTQSAQDNLIHKMTKAAMLRQRVERLGREAAR